MIPLFLRLWLLLMAVSFLMRCYPAYYEAQDELERARERAIPCRQYYMYAWQEECNHAKRVADKPFLLAWVEHLHLSPCGVVPCRSLMPSGWGEILCLAAIAVVYLRS